VLAAGALQYSIGKFLTALTLGRTVRFVLLAFLAAHYGRGIMTYVSKHGHPVTVTIVLVLATAAVIFFVAFKNKWQGRAHA
jgi:membrane protein DedA with SNARE-associated domain